MSNTESDRDNWLPCPPGELRRLSKRLAVQRRRRQLIQATALGAALLLSAGIGGMLAFFANRQPEFHYGGIACSEVRSVAPQYMAGTLDASTAERVRVHMAACPVCAKLVQGMHSHLPNGPQPMPSPATTTRSGPPEPFPPLAIWKSLSGN